MGPTRASSATRYELAAEFVRARGVQLPGQVVFDIGAGKLPMKQAIETSSARWYGFDLFPADSAVRRWNLEEACPIDVKADSAILLDVLEHLFNPGLALANIANALKPGGELLLTMPNPKWSRGRLHFLARGYLPAFYTFDLESNHHVFVPLPHVVERLLADGGFEVVDYVTIDGTTAWPGLSTRFPAELLATAAGKLIEWRDPSSCGFSYALVARKVGQPGQGLTGARSVQRPVKAAAAATA